jgi:hypothetical protein
VERLVLEAKLSNPNCSEWGLGPDLTDSF